MQTPGIHLTTSSDVGLEDGDDDEDGYDNWLDICPDSNPEELIFEGGCNFEQQDEDSDGIPNGDDGCPYRPLGRR